MGQFIEFVFHSAEFFQNRLGRGSVLLAHGVVDVQSTVDLIQLIAVKIYFICDTGQIPTGFHQIVKRIFNHLSQFASFLKDFSYGAQGADGMIQRIQRFIGQCLSGILERFSDFLGMRQHFFLAAQFFFFCL
ncbi:hypothetical protein SDC9_139164 [bioreactor metagenome]|uniref:Uncharacterized protein n=1 Tax=bioreactor metagenome TaxID=1076179 RepID=A0A645DRC0_9ZZZZ